jgi:5-methylcytosine-specific restriction endonuclease McrA/endogenous inhibitor of DNA gyrase (YacG/DUF329 family)
MAPPRKPENYVTINCPVCGKEITYHKARRVTTCSLECRKALYYPDKRTTTTCPTCGKVFEYLKSWPRVYCSRACSGKATIGNISQWQANPPLETTCEQCGNIFMYSKSRGRGRFCSKHCNYDWLREHAPKGEENPQFGIKRGRPKQLPPPVTKACIVCGQEFQTKASHLSRRQTCSKKCYGKLAAERSSGENNFNWKGGYQPYYGKDWRQQRRAARRRDRYTCQRCGITEDNLGRQLDVHHIRRFGDFSDYQEANKMSNLISLCNVCHLIVERGA